MMKFKLKEKDETVYKIQKGTQFTYLRGSENIVTLLKEIDPLNPSNKSQTWESNNGTWTTDFLIRQFKDKGSGYKYLGIKKEENDAYDDKTI